MDKEIKKVHLKKQIVKLILLILALLVILVSFATSIVLSLIPDEVDNEVADNVSPLSDEWYDVPTDENVLKYHVDQFNEEGSYTTLYEYIQHEYASWTLDIDNNDKEATEKLVNEHGYTFVDESTFDSSTRHIDSMYVTSAEEILLSGTEVIEDSIIIAPNIIIESEDVGALTINNSLIVTADVTRGVDINTRVIVNDSFIYRTEHSLGFIEDIGIELPFEYNGNSIIGVKESIKGNSGDSMNGYDPYSEYSYLDVVGE